MNKMHGLIPCHRLCAILVTLCWLAPASAQDMIETALDAAGVPKVAAFLPDQFDVARTAPLPIDGVWRVNTINKKIRIEQGRAYALDPWRHLFVLQISPGMVVMQDFRRTGPGVYAADDLPLLGPATLTLNRDGHLDVAVQGKMGPARYQLIRLDAQYPDALTHELSAMNGTPGVPTMPPAPLPAPAPAPAPGWTPPPAASPGVPPMPAPENCTPIGIDPDTGMTICA